MSTINVNAIDKESGSTLTLGGSGTTVQPHASATVSGFGETNSPSWMAKIGASQSLSGSTWTVIEIASEQVDTDSAFDTSTYAFTVPSGKAGIYLVTGGCMFPNGNDGYHYRLRFTVDGSSAGYTTWGRHEGSGGTQGLAITAILNLSVGEVVKMEGYAETAGSIGAASGDDQERCFFGGFLVSGA